MLMLLVAACGSPANGPDAPSAVDLGDASIMERLGIEEPRIDWERSIDRLTYVGQGAPPSEAELALVRRVIDDVPTPLLESVGIRYVVRSSELTTARPAHPTAAAFALGPDIYLLDRAFGLSTGGSTRYDLARAVAHELAHVAQFETLEKEYLDAVFTGALAEVDPTVGSRLVAEFAEVTGWSLNGTGLLDRSWSLGPGVEAASAYGSTGAGEDMAESVALVVLGQSDVIGAERTRFVETWLGAPADALAIGQPWVPPGSDEVLSQQPLYDIEAVAAAQGALRNVEPLYFQLPGDVPETEALVGELESRLRARVLTGSLERIPDDRVPRFGGRFNRPDGTMWWVELWDFRHKAAGTTGPSEPILVYVSIW